MMRAPEVVEINAALELARASFAYGWWLRPVVR